MLVKMKIIVVVSNKNTIKCYTKLFEFILQAAILRMFEYTISGRHVRISSSYS